MNSNWIGVPQKAATNGSAGPQPLMSTAVQAPQSLMNSWNGYDAYNYMAAGYSGWPTAATPISGYTGTLPIVTPNQATMTATALTTTASTETTIKPVMPQLKVPSLKLVAKLVDKESTKSSSIDKVSCLTT